MLLQVEGADWERPKGNRGSFTPLTPRGETARGPQTRFVLDDTLGARVVCTKEHKSVTLQFTGLFFSSCTPIRCHPDAERSEAA
jgi:hypothetical protein